MSGGCDTGSDASIHGAWTKGSIGLPPGQMVPLPHQRGAGDGNIGSDASIHGAPTMRGFGVPRNQTPPQQETGCMVKGGKSDRTGVKQRKCPTIVTCEAARESVISRSYPPGNAVAKTGLKTKKTKKYFIQGNLGENEKKYPEIVPHDPARVPR